MKKNSYLITLLVSLSVICGCSENNRQGDSDERVAKGDVILGGVLRVNENEPVQTLFPHSIFDVVSDHVASQIYEGLVKLDPRDLKILPSLASSWEIDETGTRYTFYLKKGVRFHDDPCFKDGIGRDVSAQDVKYSFELLCTPGLFNNAFSATFKDKLLGASKYYDAAESGKPNFDLEGLKVIDDYTVQLILEKPSLSFIYLLAQSNTVIIAQEAVDKYGSNMRIGTGPFRFPDNKQQEDILILVRNKKYHDVDTLGNSLPYLDSVVFSFIKTKHEELQVFKDGKLDVLMGLPPEAVNEIIEKQIVDFQKNPPQYIIDRAPEMSTQYYDLNIINSVFKDKTVRKAFSYAIDRERILNVILKGEGYGPGINGISPPSFKGYDVTKIKGYSFNPDTAKLLLAKAGFPEGKGFPQIKFLLNSGGEKNIKVALEVISQLRNNLGVNVDMEIVSFAQKIEAATRLNGDMFRAAWVADYPNPENFLALFYGKSVPFSLEEPSFLNVTRYQNLEFDKLYESGMDAPSKEESYKYFMQAEQILMEDAPVLVLYYNENFKLYQGTVMNFYSNPMQHWDFSAVYKKSLEEQAKEKVNK